MRIINRVNRRRRPLSSERFCFVLREILRLRNYVAASERALWGMIYSLQFPSFGLTFSSVTFLDCGFVSGTAKFLSVCGLMRPFRLRISELDAVFIFMGSVGGGSFVALAAPCRTSAFLVARRGMSSSSDGESLLGECNIQYID